MIRQSFSITIQFSPVQFDSVPYSILRGGFHVLYLELAAEATESMGATQASGTFIWLQFELRLLELG